VTLFLAASEVVRLTGRRQFAAQRRALDRLKIPYTQAATGEPLVLADALDAKPKAAKHRGHRWDRIGSVRQLRP